MEQEFNKQEPFACPSADNEIDLTHLFLVIWKRKLMIVTVTLMLTVLAVGLSFIMPRIYEVNSILEPGKDEDGNLFENPQSIREKILGGAYDKIVKEKLKISLDEIPTFKVLVPRQTDLVMISLESDKPQQAVAILKILLAAIADKILIQLENRKEIVRNELKTVTVEDQSIPNKILLVEDMIQKAEQNIINIENSRVTKRKLSSNEDPMTVLLFLSQIQNQQALLNAFQEKLVTLQKEKDKRTIEISNLRFKLASIKGVTINKQPAIPDKAIKPNRTLMVALAFMLGLVGGIMLAFLAEFITKEREQQQAG